MFNEIGQPRFNSELVRTFGMKIGGAAAPTLAPEVAPSFDVNQQDDPALFFLRNERMCAHAGASVAAAVGNYSRILIRNPAASGVLVVVDKVLMISANAGYALLASTTVDDATLQASYVKDMRWNGIGFASPTAIVSHGNAAAIEPNAGNGRVLALPAVMTGYMDADVILPPGTALYLYPGAQNTAINLRGFQWRERPIAAEELATG